MEKKITTSSLALLKKDYGISDDMPIKYEEKDNEIILHIQLQTKYHSNDVIIDEARKLARQRKGEGWTRQDFFADFTKVRDKVIKQIRAYYDS